MSQTLSEVIQAYQSKLDKCIQHTIHEFGNIRAGKAMPQMLDGIMVEYYGNMTPLSQLANISAPDTRTLLVQPWENTILPDIERAIINSNLGFAPGNDGHIIRITIPPLTEERRLHLVKTLKTESENSKIGARNDRKDTNLKIKQLQKDGLSEDEAKDAESQVQKMLDSTISQIDELATAKEKEVMTV
jgi:ribosome recycling factor